MDGERSQIRVHDLRGMFVTIAVANGKSANWVSDRTGHRSSRMISKYERTARSFMELEAGELTPLDAALPELADLEPLRARNRRGGGPKGGPEIHQVA